MADSHDRKENLSRPYDSQLAARLLRYLYPYKWSVLGALVLTILNAPLSTAGPLLTKAAIDLFLASDPSRPPAGYVLWLKQSADLLGLKGAWQRGLVFIAILFLLANIAQSAAQYLQVVITENVGQMAIHDLRVQIFSHLQKVPIQFYDRNPMGELMTRLTTDVDALNEMLSSGMITVLGHTATALYVFGLMFRLSWPLALVSCAILLAMVVFTVWVRTIARSTFRYFRERIAEVNAFLQEHLDGMQVVQIFTREAREMKKFERINRKHCEAGTAATLRNALFYPVIEIIASIGIALIIWYGGGQVMRETVSLGTLVAFIQLAQLFYDPVTEIGSKYHALQAALASSERIFRLLDEPIAILPKKRSRRGPVRGRIEFRNVWFAYQDNDWVLKNVSFLVEPGEKVAFVGRTGAGKTTITNLLLRFHEIQRGQILFDDMDIRQMDPEDLRSNVAIVPQDIFLFSADIASNIRLGDQSISEERVKSAARQVHLDKFIVELEKGYQYEVRERGVGLSVGQKQLVGFARALAFNRPILVLDEATSSIDTRTEIQIRDAIERIIASRTALVIAHRLSTIQAMDRILVMHKGEVRESGDHKSLLARRGFYWKLHQLQFCHKLATAGEMESDN
jgi:ATP-binding cassette subfamily B multidrug efflux pump